MACMCICIWEQDGASEKLLRARSSRLPAANMGMSEALSTYFKGGWVEGETGVWGSSPVTEGVWVEGETGG